MKVLLFADPELASSVTLLEASLRAGGARADVELLAVVDTMSAPSSRLSLPRALAARGVRAIFNLGTAAAPEDVPLLDSWRLLARRMRIPVLESGERGVNDPAFVETVRGLQPDATIALMVSQIFRAPLLAACDTPVNYHNSLLPDYRGIAATGWSIYEQAPRSGFSFHLMSEQVDRGATLLQDAVPLGPTSSAAPVERAKTTLACSKLDELFDLLPSVDRDRPGQADAGSSFSYADLNAVRTIDEPEAFSLAELELRLRAFEILDLALAGRRWRTTALRRVGRRARHRQLAFTTSDGVSVEPSRLLHLPPLAFGALRPMLRTTP